jgi:hypothetical protein
MVVLAVIVGVSICDLIPVLAEIDVTLPTFEVSLLKRWISESRTTAIVSIAALGIVSAIILGTYRSLKRVLMMISTPFPPKPRTAALQEQAFEEVIELDHRLRPIKVKRPIAIPDATN